MIGVGSSGCGLKMGCCRRRPGVKRKTSGRWRGIYARCVSRVYTVECSGSKCGDDDNRPRDQQVGCPADQPITCYPLSVGW